MITANISQVFTVCQTVFYMYTLTNSHTNFMTFGTTITRTSLAAQIVKHLPSMLETWIWSLGWEDPLEKEMATYSSTLAWKTPWTEKRGVTIHGVAKSWTRLNDFTFNFSFTVTISLLLYIWKLRHQKNNLSKVTPHN